MYHVFTTMSNQVIQRKFEGNVSTFIISWIHIADTYMK